MGLVRMGLALDWIMTWMQAKEYPVCWICDGAHK